MFALLAQMYLFVAVFSSRYLGGQKKTTAQQEKYRKKRINKNQVKHLNSFFEQKTIQAERKRSDKTRLWLVSIYRGWVASDMLNTHIQWRIK